LRRLIAYFDKGSDKTDRCIETIEPVSTIRSRVLVEGYVLQLDRDGLEFQNPFTGATVLIF
jgi:hypothetical protein